MSAIRPELFQSYSLETTAKDAAGFVHTRALMPEGVPVNIAFIGSETFDDRLTAIGTLRSCGASPRPIISARRLTSSDVLGSFLERAVAIGKVREIFLVGGDPSTPKGPFNDSMDIIRGGFLDPRIIETVGIAGYPEGHPRVDDDVLWGYLKLKVETLMRNGFNVEITTQLSFDPDAVVSWVERVRREGIHVPIRIGIPGPSTVGGILHFARQCRVGTSIQLLRRFGWQITSLLTEVGPDRFLASLIQETAQRDLGAMRLHIFPLGDLSRSINWFHEYEASHYS